MSNGLDFYWVQSSPSVQSIWTGLDSKFWPDFWAWTGWTNFWLGWTDWTFIWSNDDGLDWAGPNFVNGPGLLAYSRTIKMHAQLSNMPYFDPNFLRFDHLHQFYPFQVSPNVSKCNFVAKKNGKINFLSATRHDSRTTFHPIVRRHRSSVVNVISRQLSSTV